MNLTVKEEADFPQSCEVVRAYIHRVRNWPAFATKVQQVSGDAEDFKGKLLHRNRQIGFVGKKTHSENHDTLTFLLVAEEVQGPVAIRIAYTIKKRRKGCRVIEAVTFDQSIPFFPWLILRLQAFYRKPVGETNLSNLKKALQAQTA